MHLPLDYFDQLAGTYDDDFSNRLAGRWLRQIVQDRLEPLLSPGLQILEIGCGTGIDAQYFASRGCQVVATDASPAMLANVQQRIEQKTQAIRCLQWDLNQPVPDSIAALPKHDLIFSNFGAFNCLEPTPELPAKLAGQLKTGAYMALVVMGPICPWEIVWFGVRGSRSVMSRRWRRRAASNNAGLTLSYPTSGALTQLLDRHFRCVSVAGIGVFLPPSFAFHLVERYPKLFAKLAKLERRTARMWPFTHLNDHYLAIFQKR